MNLEIFDESNIEATKILFRKMRNDIVGSVENKMEYIKNNYFHNVLTYYVEMKDNHDIEYLKLLISIINSFVLTHSSDIKLILSNYQALTHKTIKIILSYAEIKTIDKSFFENCFRLLKSLAVNGMFSMEKCFSTGFMNRIEEFLLNDICYQYISKKICESSYYKHHIYNNEKLIENLIQKFFENKNKQLIPYLLGVLTSLTDENAAICKRIYDLKIRNVITSYIRFYDSNIKILAINLIINVYSNSNVDYTKESMVIWSNSILLNLIKEESSNTPMKIRCMNILSMIIKKSSEMQNVFYNLDGIEILLKELRSLYTEEKIKEYDEHVKSLKSNKSKKNEKIFLLEKEDDNNSMGTESYSLNNALNETEEYKSSIVECLASATSSKEDSRKKIIDSKEICIILCLLEDPNHKILLSAANLILSLSRANSSIKKFLHEYDITSLLFKLSNHSNIEIQIVITNSLCNFLLDYSSNIFDIVECVSKLLKIFHKSKHNKIRLNAIFSIKNILYYCSSCNVVSSSYRVIKKDIMKKITYDFLLSLLDDEDVNIQEQTLIIFRSLLHKSSEDIEEIFSNCKAKLLKKLEEKLNSNNNELILQSLYVLLNISVGNEKQKSVLFDDFFLRQISAFLEFENNAQFKSVCVLILNNLLTTADKNAEHAIEKKIAILNKFNIISKLEKIASDEDEDSEIKQTASLILSQSKNLNAK